MRTELYVVICQLLYVERRQINLFWQLVIETKSAFSISFSYCIFILFSIFGEIRKLFVTLNLLVTQNRKKKLKNCEPTTVCRLAIMPDVPSGSILTRTIKLDSPGYMKIKKNRCRLAERPFIQVRH